MALTKVVNGIEYTLSPTEEKKVMDEWASCDAEKEQKRAAYELVRYREDRKKEYPDIGDQLDAILKQLNYMQLNGQTDLITEMDGIIGDWLAIKRKYPKPEEAQ